MVDQSDMNSKSFRFTKFSVERHKGVPFWFYADKYVCVLHNENQYFEDTIP